MMNDLTILLRMIGQTIQDPARVADDLMQRKFGLSALWMGLVLTTILNVLLLGLMPPMGSIEIPMPDGVFVIAPLTYGIVTGGLLAILVLMIHQSGRLLGSEASFEDTLTLLVWLQVIGIAIRAVSIIVQLFNPLLAAVVSLVGIGVLLRCLLNFVNVLHRFEDMGKAVLTLIIASVGTLFGGMFLLAFMGVNPGGGPT